MTTLVVVLIILMIVGMTGVGIYNRMITLRNAIGNASGDMDVQMKMRFDLVDNLVNTVKWYADHEKTTFEEITKARTGFMSATSPAEKDAASNMLTSSLKSLFAVSENYPELKANTNFLQLQNQLSDIENQIAASRRYYNATIKDYNDAIMTFPNNLLAGIFGFVSQTWFLITDESQKNAPKVDFGK